MKLGEKIRAKRKEMGLSLRDLADKVDLSTSFLSQLERDQNNPSVETLQRISDALDTPVYHFFVTPELKSPVVRRDKRLKLIIPDTHFEYQLLTPDLKRDLQLLIAEMEPGEVYSAIEFIHHTEECIYVLQGQLKISLGDNSYILGSGDSIYFDGFMLKSIEAVGDLTLRYIIAITPPIF